ncbi:serine/threonine-protein kinase [Pseudonocardia sp. TRM90224]|uniref:serine/threonine-protein kinase n=1 Tax=Pseudonocardia sp. TRM90224 TaxID=2812678 RepID=UPI001E31664B|nr:serine/threonine-protein kinase [Pseudonocardia sp. TRM90224]
MDMFGPYRLDGLVGRGGMGEVYRAFDTRKSRTVALKLLAPHLADDAGFQDRFRRESELAARLREPHVIPIHDYGSIDGRLYIDMRLVDGLDLETVIHRHGPMQPVRAVHILAQVASALDAAHADGLIHRDVKPSNVLLATETRRNTGDTGDDGEFAYLVDFGIAAPTTGDRLTMTGTTLGSMDYMAPELFDGDKRDNRIDIYSLACVLYTLLTARKPFIADGFAAMMFAHLTATPPRASDHVLHLPAGMDAVIARGMAKEPNERFQHATELVQAARAVLTGPAPARTPPMPAVAPIHPQTGSQAPGPVAPVPPGPPGHGATTRHHVRSAPAAPGPPPRRRRRALQIAIAFLVAVVAIAGATVLIVTRPAATTATGPTGVAAGLASNPYVDVNKRFTIHPPLGWEVDTSSVLSFGSKERTAEEPVAAIVIFVVTNPGSLENAVAGSRQGAVAAGEQIFHDQPTTLPDGSPAHLFGIKKPGSVAGPGTRYYHLVAVRGTSLYLVDGIVDEPQWDTYEPVVSASLKTFVITTA